jgi:hypothetical protein
MACRVQHKYEGMCVLGKGGERGVGADRGSGGGNQRMCKKWCLSPGEDSQVHENQVSESIISVVLSCCSIHQHPHAACGSTALSPEALNPLPCREGGHDWVSARVSLTCQSKAPIRAAACASRAPPVHPQTPAPRLQAGRHHSMSRVDPICQSPNFSASATDQGSGA